PSLNKSNAIQGIFLTFSLSAVSFGSAIRRSQGSVLRATTTCGNTLECSPRLLGGGNTEMISVGFRTNRLPLTENFSFDGNVLFFSIPVALRVWLTSRV